MYNFFTYLLTYFADFSVVTIVISVFVILTILLMFIVIIVFLIVVRRHRSARGTSSRRGRLRRRRSTSASSAPDYDAPYVVCGPSGPNGERQLRLVGLDDTQSTVLDPSALPAFKGTLVEPPPYPEEPPPPFVSVDQVTNVARSSADNHGFEEDRAEDESATSPDTGRSTRNKADLPSSSGSE